MISTILFWLILVTLLYTYAGYGLVLYLLVKIKGITSKKNPSAGDIYEPEVCLFVTAYNECDYVDQKVQNSLQLEYPADKIQFLWVTDGSDDGTPELLRKWPQIEVEHLAERKGKIAAMNRGIAFVKKPIVIFSDANTLLSPNTIRRMVEAFADPNVGCVAGEKRIIQTTADSATAAGEGLYWKLESKIKLWDATLNSAIGGVGELFAIRTALFEPVEDDTLLDDFVISLRIAGKGYRIAYTPDAYAEERASLNVREELKRKIRIAAGGMQTIFRLPWLFNIFKYRWLSWQYFSHKVLRWSLAPLFLFLFLPLNVYMVGTRQLWAAFSPYSLILYGQIVFYLMALSGFLLENRRMRNKLFFAPYYFLAINYAACRGMYRYFKGSQKVTWEKSKRA